MLHKNATPAERHAPWSWEFANAAARAAVSGLSASDVNKVALQQDDSSTWILVSHSPVVWAPASGGGWMPALHKADPTTPCLVKTGAGTLSVKAGTLVKVGVNTIDFASQTAVAMPALSAGEDYSVWVLPNGTAQAVADPFFAPASAPAAGALKIGGFHYGLVAPGTTVAAGSFATTGAGMIWTQADVDLIAGINVFSIWDLSWRSLGEQRGFALDPQSKTWWAIYFCSTNHITNGISRYNTNVASGTLPPLIPKVFGGSGASAYGSLRFFEANEVVLSHGCRLPTYEEFVSAAFGVTEYQSFSGGAVVTPVTTRQPGFTSRIGLEQVTGHQWTLGRFHGAGGAGWTDMGRGKAYAEAGLLMLGGSRTQMAEAGSRCASWSSLITNSTWATSVRAVCDHYQG